MNEYILIESQIMKKNIKRKNKINSKQPEPHYQIYKKEIFCQ